MDSGEVSVVALAREASGNAKVALWSDSGEGSVAVMAYAALGGEIVASWPGSGKGFVVAMACEASQDGSWRRGQRPPARAPWW